MRPIVKAFGHQVILWERDFDLHTTGEHCHQKDVAGSGRNSGQPLWKMKNIYTCIMFLFMHMSKPLLYKAKLNSA